jgi:hypothetical protein
MTFLEAQQRTKKLNQIETQLLQYNLERDGIKDELIKIPTHAKTGAQIRRRSQLEGELSILTK